MMGRRGLVASLFLLPALLFLGALVVYPVFRTIFDSFFDRLGLEFVGFDNYVTMFGLDRMKRAMLNSAIWVIVFPFLVTSVGLVLAVLADKLKWKTAFKLILFLPAAIAVMSSGIIWRIMYESQPSRGVINALINVPVSAVSPGGDYEGAVPSTEDIVVADDVSLIVPMTVGPDGATARIGLLRIPVDAIPEDSVDAGEAVGAGAGTVAVVVWRDTKPGDNVRGVVEPGEAGLPGIPVVVVDQEGSVVSSGETIGDGTVVLEGVPPGEYRLRIDGNVFQEPWGGVSWLGPSLVTLSAIFSGMWIWAGFALVMIGAGLAALPTEVIEAARVDGASSWQVFSRVTVPLLAPVLTVVAITLTINAVKMFDLILGVAPGSVQDEANVIGLEMWRTAFTGVGNRGLGSAIAVFLFILILPILAINIRRFRVGDQQ